MKNPFKIVREVVLTKAEKITTDVWVARADMPVDTHPASVEWTIGDFLLSVAILMTALVGGPRKES